MLRPATALLLVLLTSSAALVGALAPSPPPAPAEGKAISQHLAEHLHEHGGGHPTAAALLMGRDPLANARDALTVDLHRGRTASAWVADAKAERLLALRPDAPAEGDLVAEVLRLHALAGVRAGAADVASLHAQADALPAALRAPLGGLVREVADAYAAQLPLARDVLARRTAEPSADAPLLGEAQRDAMAANAERVIAAQNLFRQRVAGLDLGTAAFADPLGLVVVGGAGDDAHAPTGVLEDPVLLVDLGGNDVYTTRAGAACPDLLNLAHVCNGLALSVLVDLAGHDTYSYAGAPSVAQGAGSFGGVGILVDAAGDDRYFSLMTRVAERPLYHYVDGGAQGFGQAGYGVLLDAAGHDLYRADVQSLQGLSVWDFAQGFGGLGGVGVLADAGGDDSYLANGLGIPKSTGFQGVYNNGAGFYGGVGLLVDTGAGNDRYHAWNNGTTVDYYAQGFGAFGGLGILYEDGGNDDYLAVEIAYDPFIVPLLNCAFGTGSLGGVGVFLEMGGDDTYYGDTQSPRAASTMNEGFGGIGAAYGLFVDVSGDDGHFMYANGGGGSYTAGRGVVVTRGNILGNYLDLGGSDQYVGASSGLLLGGSRDNAAWLGGADVNAPVGDLGWMP